MQHRSHPTLYKGVQFRSRLEARWAAFFDLTKVKWQYEPLNLIGWMPDFLVEFTLCRYRQQKCSMPRKALVEIKPALDYAELLGLKPFGMPNPEDFHNDPIPMLLGINPHVAVYCCWSCNGDGGGMYESIHDLCGIRTATSSPNRDVLDLWNEAGNMVQWKGR